MSIGSEYWRKEVESLKSQLQEKNEDLDSLKRSYDFNYENLKYLQDKLESCPVSGEVVVKLKGIYHTFFKAKINHPDYFDETDRKVEEVAKEFDSSYEQTKRDNESLKQTNRRLMKRIKQLKGRCDALQEERDKFAHEIEDLRVASQAALRAAELVKAHPEICSTFTVHLSDESKKIAELNKEVADLHKKNADLQKKNRELSELIGEEVWGSKC